MQKQHENNQQNPDKTDPGQLPRRDRSDVDDAPDNTRDRGLRQDRTIDDPGVDELRRAPGAENAEDELDDEDFEGEEEIRR